MEGLLNRMVQIGEMLKFNENDLDQVRTKFILWFTENIQNLPFQPNPSVYITNYFTMLESVNEWWPFGKIGLLLHSIEATEAGAERAFSKLKRIRSDLRTRSGQVLENAKLTLASS